jgi:glutamine cyclotransferase
MDDARWRSAAVLIAGNAPAAPGSGGGGGELRFHRLQVLRRLPHPGRGFTQGLIVADGTVWESSGGYGQSCLRRYELGAQQPDGQAPLPPDLFGEGICRAGAHIWQLTWQERVALRWDARSLELVGTVPTSDGSSELVLRDPGTLEPYGLVRVRLDGGPVPGLNDLEWRDGHIWANLLGKRYLVAIDAGSGEVTDVVDAKAVMERHWGDREAVLNGVASLPGAGEFLLTGKGWRSMYHVRLAADRVRQLPARLRAD